MPTVLTQLSDIVYKVKPNTKSTAGLQKVAPTHQYELAFPANLHISTRLLMYKQNLIVRCAEVKQNVLVPIVRIPLACFLDVSVTPIVSSFSFPSLSSCFFFLLCPLMFAMNGSRQHLWRLPG